MAIPNDPGTGLQDNVKDPIKVSGTTGLHARFKPLYDAFNGAIDSDNLSAALLALINNALAAIPIGTILPFYDFNALVTFDTDLFKYCDGAIVADIDSPINGQTLPDLSSRYLVGFGTDGGGNIDSAGWSATPVGNPNHQIDLEHDHIVTSHNHTLSNHTHAGPSHTHDFGFFDDGAGNLFLAQGLSVTDLAMFTLQSDDGSGDDPGNVNALVQMSNPASDRTFTTVAAGTGNTGTPSTNTSGNTAPGTNTQLSTTESIQPRSVRVRFIMRYK